MKHNTITKRTKSVCTGLTLLAALAVNVFAATDNTTVGDLGTGYLNGTDPSAYAETSANSSGSSSDDFVSVTLSFSEWNPKLDKSYEKTNAGANYTTAWLSESGQNPVSASGGHGIQRGDTYRSGSTGISY